MAMVTTLVTEDTEDMVPVMEVMEDMEDMVVVLDIHTAMENNLFFDIFICQNISKNVEKRINVLKNKAVSKKFTF